LSDRRYRVSARQAEPASLPQYADPTLKFADRSSGNA
jgi:hypothetical protein